MVAQAEEYAGASGITLPEGAFTGWFQLRLRGAVPGSMAGEDGYRIRLRRTAGEPIDFGTFPVKADQILTPSYLLTPTSLQTLLDGGALVVEGTLQGDVLWSLEFSTEGQGAVIDAATTYLQGDLAGDIQRLLGGN